VGRGFDELLKSNPYRSRRSIVGTLNLVMIDLEIKFRSSDPKSAEIIAKARRLLRSKIGRDRPTKAIKNANIGQAREAAAGECYDNLVQNLGHLTYLTYQNPAEAVAFCSNVVIPSLSAWQ